METRLIISRNDTSGGTKIFAIFIAFVTNDEPRPSTCSRLLTSSVREKKNILDAMFVLNYPSFETISSA